jgi:hypothetical protein
MPYFILVFGFDTTGKIRGYLMKPLEKCQNRIRNFKNCTVGAAKCDSPWA